MRFCILLLAVLGASWAYAERQWEIPLFLSGNDAHGRQGFVRIINLDSRSGTVIVEAIDESGQSFGSFALDVKPDERRHFNSDHVSERIGGPGEGHWRLLITSNVNILPLAYIRSPDGFLAPVNGSMLLWSSDAYIYSALTFNPASNTEKKSFLRLTNPHDIETEANIRGADDTGTWTNQYTLPLPPMATKTITIQDLEREWGMDGTGKWQLTITSARAIRIMNMLESVGTGHLINMSVHRLDFTDDGPFAPANDVEFYDRVRGKKVCADSCGPYDDYLYFDENITVTGDRRATFVHFSVEATLEGDWEYESTGPNTATLKLIYDPKQLDDTCWVDVTFDSYTSATASSRCLVSPGRMATWRVVNR